MSQRWDDPAREDAAPADAAAQDDARGGDDAVAPDASAPNAQAPNTGDADDAPYDPRSIGEVLADARLAHGWTLAQVTEALRIQEDYLGAIETMDPRGLPASAFVGGYVRSYAGLLGLDPAAAAERFKREIATGVGLELAPPGPSAPIELPVRPLLGLGAGLALVGAVWLGWPRSGDVVDIVPPVPEGLREWVSTDPSAARRTGVIDAPQYALRARIATRVTVRSGEGRVHYDGRLDAGATTTLPDRPDVRIDADNAAAVELLRDGAVLERLGRSNLPVSAWSLGDAQARARAADAAAEALAAEAAAAADPAAMPPPG